MIEEYNKLKNCLGYTVSIIISSTEILSSRLLNLSVSDDTLIVFLTNGLEAMFITKSSSEYKQYAVQLKGIKSNKGFYMSDIDIKDKYKTVSFVNI